MGKNDSERRRAMVTGGAGFLGSHLCDRLIQEGLHVTCVDNLYTGRRRNVEHLLDHPGFDFVEHDVSLPMAHAGPLHEIYNLACPASPPHYQRDPIQTTRTSVLGALNLLELARRSGARIFQASTSEVYGDPELHPQPEPYWGRVNPVGIRSCYDEGKRCAETLFMDYRRQHGVDVRIGRIFNTYGPRMDPQDGRVVSNFIVQALRGEPITVYGSGRQTRSFCYVDDLVGAFLRYMRAPGPLPGPINLGNPQEFTVGELAKMVVELTRSQSEVIHKPLPSDDPRQRRPDIRLAQEKLGWQPSVPLREGLGRTIRYFEQLLAVPVD